MGIVGKLEIEMDIKSSGDLFHELFSSKPHNVSGIIPHRVEECKLHDGEYGNYGSVITWYYVDLDGKKKVVKCHVEKDEDKKIFTYSAIGGDLLEDFKKLTAYVEVIPKGEISGVKWTAEFEKINDDGPYPTQLMDFWIAITKDIEAHHFTLS